MKSLLLAGMVLCIGVAGCSSITVTPVNSNAIVNQQASPVLYTADYTPSPILIDGVLDEAVWQKAPAYPLFLGQDRAADGTVLEESGSVRFAWDENNVYVAVTYTDSDIVAEGTQDEQLHFNMGDVAEVFLKPGGNTCYWELYVTPHGNKSTLFFPGRGRMGLPGSIEYSSGLQVGAKVNGTLDAWQDNDEGWTAELAIPVKDLTAYGDAFGPGSDWRVLVARYNYSKNLNIIGPELSMTPQLPQTFFHLTDGYAKLEFKN